MIDGTTVRSNTDTFPHPGKHAHMGLGCYSLPIWPLYVTIAEQLHCRKITSGMRDRLLNAPKTEICEFSYLPLPVSKTLPAR